MNTDEHGLNVLTYKARGPEAVAVQYADLWVRTDRRTLTNRCPFECICA